MITLMWNLSTAIRRYLRTSMPSNIAIDLLRTRRGLKWAVPAALVMVPTYLFPAVLAASAVEHGGPGWLNVLLLLFAWNAMKFAWMGVLSLLIMLRRSVAYTRALPGS